MSITGFAECSLTVGAVESAGEEVHGDPPLAAIPGGDGRKIDSLHWAILEGETSDRRAAAVDEDIAPQWLPLPTVGAIHSIGIVDAQRQVELTPGIESVEVIEAFRHLEVSFAMFRS